MEAGGQAKGNEQISEDGMRSFDAGDRLGSLRFGKAPDPDDPSRSVLVFRAHMNDALSWGAPRTELSFGQASRLPVGQDFWYGFGLRTPGWNVRATDEQLLTQWHQGNGTIPLGPFMALLVKGNNFKLDVKFNLKYPPSIATTNTTTVWTGSGMPVDKWTYFVFKAKISPDLKDDPYLQVWKDGVQIVDYHGPFGYNYPDVKPYVKLGHYEWIASYNRWDPDSPVKTVYYRTPVLIRDNGGKYSEADVRAYLSSQ